LKNAAMKCSIRWMIRRDMPAVLQIEQASFEYPWSEEEFLRVLRLRNCIGMVNEVDDRIVGFFIYELQRSKIQILDLAVCPKHVRRGIGTQMFEKLKGKLSMDRRHSIAVMNRETNVAGSLFLKSLGFTGELIRGHFEDSREDGILFNYRLNLVAEFVRDCEKSVA
jgi:[ribosomal protein S18]-alanine N-acetyltransferase